MQCPTCKGYRHDGECLTSDVDDYDAYVADAKAKQAAYLAFLQTIPSVFLRTHEQQEQADMLDWIAIQASRRARNAERDAYWALYDERQKEKLNG